MKTINASACRFCKHFQPEGRRGGFCQQLGTSVRGCWDACPLALPPFAPSWESGAEHLYQTSVKVEPGLVQELSIPVKPSSSVWNHAHKCQLSVTKTKFSSLKV